jgi:putative SOS response-associated peptidase YedK
VCGRFYIKNPGAAVERVGIEKLVENRLPLGLPELTRLARLNVCPAEDVLVLVAPTTESYPESAHPAKHTCSGGRPAVLAERPDGRQLRAMRWGYEPAWMAQRGIGKPQINARSETLEERATFKGALARRRCIILADGFYEWQAVPGRKKKQAVHIRLKDGKPFGFAGIFARAADGELTCAIITCEPNLLMASIHHRMPVILRPEHEDPWLDPELTDPVLLASMLRPYPADEMEASPASDDLFRTDRGAPSQLALPLG